MNTSQTETADKYLVASSVKLLAVLETLSRTPHWLSSNDVASKTTVNRKELSYNEARGALYSAWAAGWVEQSDRSGETVWRLAAHALTIVMNQFEVRRQVLAESNAEANRIIAACQLATGRTA